VKIAFFSNFLNDHQLPICKAFTNIENLDFVFVATEPISQERLDLGFEDMNQLPFVIRAYESEQARKESFEVAMECDVMILGSAPEEYLKLRMKLNKLTFRYSERIYKKGTYHRFSPIAMKNIAVCHKKYRKHSLYLLCSSAYVAKDFDYSGVYRGKAFKWGYFPELKKYDDIDALINKKENNSILWVGRLIDWKHPEFAVLAAKKLKEENYDFKLRIIGKGDKENIITDMISKFDLEENVEFLGAMPPENVREYMEKSEVFLFTSNRKEGWGAVLNESMNSGCAVVASHIIGAVPFMLCDGENGFIYKDGSFTDLYNKVKLLLDNPDKKKEFGRKAYATVRDEWNADNAAKRFVALSTDILNNKGDGNKFKSGVCSKAELLKDSWYKA